MPIRPRSRRGSGDCGLRGRERMIHRAIDAISALRALRRRRRWPGRRKRTQPILELSTLSNVEALRKFRFTVPEIRYLVQSLEIPGIFYAGTCRIGSMMALALLLHRLAGTQALHDTASYFGLNEIYVSRIVRALIVWILNRWESIITFNLPRMLRSAPNYAAAIACKSRRALNNCIGFIDGTNRAIARPTLLQQAFYSGFQRF